jgi:hypothetical protein
MVASCIHLSKVGRASGRIVRALCLDARMLKWIKPFEFHKQQEVILQEYDDKINISNYGNDTYYSFGYNDKGISVWIATKDRIIKEIHYGYAM